MRGIRPDACDRQIGVPSGSVADVKAAFSGSRVFVWHDEVLDEVDETTQPYLVDGARLMVVPGIPALLN